MNWKDIASAGKSIAKVDNLQLQQSTRDGLEAVMVAMAAAGNPQQMALIAQTIEKVDTQADLKKLSAEVSALVQGLKAGQLKAAPAEESVTLTKAQFKELKAQLSK